MNITVIKRNGSKEPLAVDKWQAQVAKVCKGIADVSQSMIEIKAGRARFAHAPCKNQYCVQQGWIHRTGQMLICIPNEVSIEILGKTKAYDSLNY